MKCKFAMKNILLLAMCLFLSACSKKETLVVEKQPNNQIPQHVVAMTSSLADIWQLAGGDLVGVVSDAFTDPNLEIKKGEVADIGAVAKPNLEIVLSLKPDLVLLSKDIHSQTDLTTVLDESKIKYMVVSVENFDDYMAVLESFTNMTNRKDLFEENGVQVKKKIETLVEKIPTGTSPKVLFLRTSSSNVKAIAQNNATADILKKIGTTNIADQNGSLLDNLSMEVIIQENPDYIFAVIMGSDSEKAMNSLHTSLSSNPAWANLDAVKNNHFLVIPKDLFQYKPNERWGEAYEYLLKIIYPEVYK